MREILEEELGAAPEQLFAAFEIEPLAAASTAQVHRATLFSGEQVVVKVQRPGIQTQMKADLGIMQRAARVAARRSEQLRAIDLEGMIEQFSDSVLAELDLLGEAYNAMRLTENMAGLEGVHIPRIYPELSTSRVLTMEFIKGVKISDIEAIEAAGLEREVVARNALRAVIKQLLIDGFFHADPHPGNVLVNLQTGADHLSRLRHGGPTGPDPAGEPDPVDLCPAAGGRGGHGPDPAQPQRAVRGQGRRKGLRPGLSNG